MPEVYGVAFSGSGRPQINACLEVRSHILSTFAFYFMTNCMRANVVVVARFIAK